MDSHYFFHGNIDVHGIASSLPPRSEMSSKKAIIFYSMLRPLSIGSNVAGNICAEKECMDLSYIIRVHSVLENVQKS